jgi:hypothetical protein
MKKTQPNEPINILFKRFRMTQITPNKILVFIGKRNTGKSVLVIDYLYYNQDMPFCTCISPTDDLNLTFRPHIPSRFIFDSYSPSLIENFVKRQRALKMRKKNALAGRGDPRYKNIDSRGLLIMDDLLADVEKWKKDPNIAWIFMNGRHADITLILTMQYQMGIPPVMRVNIDYLFICKEVKRTELDKLWKNYAGVFQTFDMFLQILNQATKNYGCLVIDNTSQSDKLEDQVYIYKAALRENDDFKLCYKEFWIDNDDYVNMDLQQKAGIISNNDNNLQNQLYERSSKFKFNIKTNDNY